MKIKIKLECEDCYDDKTNTRITMEPNDMFDSSQLFNCPICGSAVLVSLEVEN